MSTSKIKAETYWKSYLYSLYKYLFSISTNLDKNSIWSWLPILGGNFSNPPANLKQKFSITDACLGFGKFSIVSKKRVSATESSLPEKLLMNFWMWREFHTMKLTDSLTNLQSQYHLDLMKFCNKKYNNLYSYYSNKFNKWFRTYFWSEKVSSRNNNKSWCLWFLLSFSTSSLSSAEDPDASFFSCWILPE